MNDLTVAILTTYYGIHEVDPSSLNQTIPPHVIASKRCKLSISTLIQISDNKASQLVCDPRIHPQKTISLGEKG